MNFLIVTHGALATGLKASVEMIIGEKKNLYTLSLEEGMDLMNFIESVDQKIQEISPTNLLVFVDIIGGTPCNSIMVLREKYPELELFYGVNSPILLEALNSEISTVDVLKKELQEVALEALGFIDV